MGETRAAYPAEFRRQMVEVVRAGRSPQELARECEPTAQSVRNWFAQSERNADRGDGGLTTTCWERGDANKTFRVTHARFVIKVVGEAASGGQHETERAEHC
jgi:transposase